MVVIYYHLIGLQHRCFTDELISLVEKAEVLAQMDIPWLRQPIDSQLDVLSVLESELAP